MSEAAQREGAGPGALPGAGSGRVGRVRGEGASSER